MIDWSKSSQPTSIAAGSECQARQPPSYNIMPGCSSCLQGITSMLQWCSLAPSVPDTLEPRLCQTCPPM